MCLINKNSFFICVICFQNPQQLEHLALLVQEEPVPPDAPPVPDENGPDPEEVPESG